MTQNHAFLNCLLLHSATLFQIPKSKSEIISSTMFRSSVVSAIKRNRQQVNIFILLLSKSRTVLSMEFSDMENWHISTPWRNLSPRSRITDTYNFVIQALFQLPVARFGRSSHSSDRVSFNAPSCSLKIAVLDFFSNTNVITYFSKLIAKF